MRPIQPKFRAAPANKRFAAPPARGWARAALARTLVVLLVTGLLPGASLGQQSSPKPAPAPQAQSPQLPLLAPPARGGQGNAHAPYPAANHGQRPASGQQGEDQYPVVAELERITFGHANTQLPLGERLNLLETTVFQKTFPDWSLFDRTEKLKETLIGPSVDPDSGPASPAPRPFVNPYAGEPGAYDKEPAARIPDDQADDPLWHEPAWQVELTEEQLNQFALELINDARGQVGSPPLQRDELASKVAGEQVEDLIKRGAVSHVNAAGLNPDQRYTRHGGSDAISECLVAFGNAQQMKPNRALVARMMRTMQGRQDDRDALLSPDATHLGFSFAFTPEHDRVIGACEIVTKHAIMHPLPAEVKVGQKIAVKGVVLHPYRFQKVTVAWEGINPPPQDDIDHGDEPMPYFPPLDFVAYSQKAERDWQTAKTILRTAGVIAAIAGGMFVPPVALAAPLIAMAGSDGELKAAPDIPVRGGMKVEGSLFYGDVELDNKGKAGLYYVTVWASPALNQRPVPISRRTVVARAEQESASPDKEKGKDKISSSESLSGTGR